VLPRRPRDSGVDDGARAIALGGRRALSGLVLRDRIGHLDQVALATEKPALDVRAYRGFEMRIHPSRGLDIGAAWFRGFPIGWISAVGEGGAEEAEDWRDAWGGGLLTTCGLDNVGAPSEGIGLHGTYVPRCARRRDRT
jgi:Domain of unknown function (DUF4432)